jgi:alkanesulfonate monooxygenase SsuD/methylene tetrahydromethanopterin reductase-like flavin-dependent oxidoreductase (luciferase family)
LDPVRPSATTTPWAFPFDERWKRFDEAIASLRALLEGEPRPERLAPAPRDGRGVPLWIGSWGSSAGLRRVARAGDGWLASAYNTTPLRFAEAREHLARELEDRGRNAESFPNALATMWTWITEDRVDEDRVLSDVLAPVLNRDPDELRGRLCIGPAAHCAALLSEYAAAGCQRVYLWPLGDERRQIESIASDVSPRIEPAG